MADVIHGNASGDQLNARTDKSQVYGLKGNDTLASDNKNDVLLVGGSGDDSLIMLGGNGTLSGGEGKDTFELTYSATKKLSAVIEDLEPSEDKIVVNFDGNTAPQLNTVRSGNDVVWRDSAGLLNVTLKGVRENDYFDGEASNEIWKVLELTNAEREKKNLPALTLSEGLMTGAEIRVEEITKKGNLGVLTDHTRLDNRTAYDTVLEGKYNYPGENLDGGAISPSQVVQEWMNSRSHRENILRKNFQKIGVGYKEDDSDPANLRWYWTQMFADSLKSPETVSTAELLTVNPQINTVSNFIAGNDDAETLENTIYGATIEALGGEDSIVNAGLLVSINGGEDNNTIDNSGSFVTVNAGKGDDQISLSADAKENVIQYAPGDGNDTVYGFNDTSTLSLASDEYYFPVIGSGKDVVVTVGEGTITLIDAAKSLINTHSPTAKILRGTEGNDTINNLYDTELTIHGSDGDDSITNWNANVSINGGEENDTIMNYGDSASITGERGYNHIYNWGSKVSIYGAVWSIRYSPQYGFYGYGAAAVGNFGKMVTVEGGAGNDDLNNYGSNVTINGGAGGDRIYNNSGTSSVSIDGGAGNDTIRNFGTEITISGDAGNDSIDNYGSSVSADAGAGSDTVRNNASNVTISAGDGNDYVRNDEDGSNVSIDAGDGNDTIGNLGSNVTIKSGEGNDSIHNEGDESVVMEAGAGDDIVDNLGSNVTINGGLGNDTIRMGNDSQNELIIYRAGDGNDVISGLNDTSTLSISGSNYTPITIDGDIALEVGTAHIKLRGAVSLPSVNIIGDKVEESRLVTLTEDDDFFLETVKFGATIEALGGDDFIINSTDYVTINGGEGNDFISTGAGVVNVNGGAGNDEIANYGDYATVNGGLGDDSITLDSNSYGSVIQYEAGDGSDTVSGFNEYSYLEISNSDYTPVTVGNDIIVSVGTDSITLLDAATLTSVNILKNYNNTVDGATIHGTDGDDYIINHGSNVLIESRAGKDSIGNGTAALPGGNNITIDAGAGDDYIVTGGNSASIDGGAGADTIRNNGGDNVTIDGNTGNDYIFNHSGGFSVSINGGAGDDTIDNHGSEATINGGLGNDSVNNGSRGSNVSVDLGDGEDIVQNFGSNVTISVGSGSDAIINDGSSVIADGGADNDQIVSNGSEVTIIGGDGNDSIGNDWKGSFVSIEGGAGNDSLMNHGSNVTINSDTGNDYIYNDGSSVSINGGDGNDSVMNLLGSLVTITGGKGDDSIILGTDLNDAKNVLIQYNLGDGNDTITGFSTDDTLKISADSSLVSSVNSGDDVIYTVGDNTIFLKDGREKPLHIIIGESGTSGGNSGNGGNNGGSSSGSGGERGGNGGGRSSGGTSASEGRNSDASGSKSAVGSAGSQTSTGTSSGSSRRPVAVQNPISFSEMLNSLMSSNHETATVANQRIYMGGNQIISDYQSGEKIVFSGTYTGSFYDEAGNYCVGSSTGALVIQNAVDKVIDLSDAAGNDFLKAYAASTAGIIDGRGLGGFEVINGSAGADAIFAGDGDSQLWGGVDVSSDILVGGGGTDIFIGGKTQGADFFLNASSADIVHLNDASLSDIVATAEENGTIGIAFNTGNVIAVHSSESMSATFMLADSSAYRYDHVNKSWIRS